MPRIDSFIVISSPYSLFSPPQAPGDWPYLSDAGNPIFVSGVHRKTGKLEALVLFSMLLRRRGARGAVHDRRHRGGSAETTARSTSQRSEWSCCDHANNGTRRGPAGRWRWELSNSWKPSSPSAAAPADSAALRRRSDDDDDVAVIHISWSRLSVTASAATPIKPR